MDIGIVFPFQNSESLLHQKLFESNTRLCHTLESAVLDGLDRVPNGLQRSMKTLDSTQADLQNTVILLQEARKNSENLVKSLDELDQTASEIKFPV